MNKNVLILGGSSSIGLASIKIFLSNNWEVHAQYNKNNNNLKKLKLNSGNMLHLYKCNFTKESEIKKFMSKISKKKICSIINLIGYIDNINYQNSNLKSLIKSLTINAIIPIIIAKKLLPYMIKIKFGRILNASSIGVKYGGSEFTYNYSFAKNALEYIPSYLRKLTSKNILTNVLRIGFVKSKVHSMIKGKNIKKRISLIPMKRQAVPSEIAKTIFNLSSDHNTYISNEIVSIAGGE
jgi:3-oxoacyl-[acyl-carrier protein] reductase